MIIGMGTDIIEINRIKDAVKKETFFKRFYTEAEREYIKLKGVQSAAGYFCAKEAVSKAMGTGFSGFKFSDIEIIKRNFVPCVVLHGNAKKIAYDLGIKNINLTISHCREYAVAFAVVEG